MFSPSMSPRDEIDAEISEKLDSIVAVAESVGRV